MKLHDDCESIDRANVEEFRKHGVLDSETERYRCVVCGEPTCIDVSFSHQGHNLICFRCAKANGMLGPDCKVLDFVREGLGETE